MAKKKPLDLLEDIITEGLTEAAESFFSRRVALDQEIELLYAKAEELKARQALVLERESTFHHLVLHGRMELLRDFYLGLGIRRDQEEIRYDPDKVVYEWFDVQGFFTKSKFVHLFTRAYAEFAEAVRDFLEGSYRPDKQEPQKKVRTLHYESLKRFCDTINEDIASLNEHSRPSDVLQFAKKVDVEAMDKERVLDTGVEYTLDKEMSFEPIRFDALGLIRFDALAVDEKAMHAVKDFAVQLYIGHTEEVWNIIKETAANK